MFGVIYKITCNATSKVYIGLTTQRLNERWNQHKSKAHSNKCNFPICNAINKYGEDSFSIETIDVAQTEQELKNKEIYWIDFYKSTNPKFGYNITLGGESGNGYHHTQETKDLISEKTKGKKKSKETVERMKKAQQEIALTRHIIPTELTRQRMSASRMGHLTSETTRQRISLSNTGKTRTAEQNSQNSKRQQGKKFLHNDLLKLNVIAFKDDISDLLNQGWLTGKVASYRNIPRKEVLNMINLKTQ